jgi:glycosidase
MFVAVFAFSCSNRCNKECEKYKFLSNASIYEVNVRQFSEEGNFDAVTAQLERLSELGVDVLWLMPISPIGVEGRKGTLGSYYSIVDYCEINPEFGTKEDFKELVDAAHKLGMKVMVDWVANHTSRDSKWLKEGHLDWYVLDSAGNLGYLYDWTDVAELNYDNKDMRNAMAEALKYWVKDFNIDGYRCDVAHEIPLEFWEYSIAELRKIKPEIIMLAESETPELNANAFDMYYAWSVHARMNELAQGKIDVNRFKNDLFVMYGRFPNNAVPMFFTSNHDENSWNGTEFERMGEAARTFAALSYCLKGMPLIYSAQEVGMNKRLEFFEKDPINWEDEADFTDFYKSLNDMKSGNTAFCAFGKMIEVETNNADIFAFRRISNDTEALCFFNLTDTVQTFKYKMPNQKFSAAKNFAAWEYEINE